MLTSIKKLFGEGKIRLEGKLECGRGFSIQVPYVGDIKYLN